MGDILVPISALLKANPPPSGDIEVPLSALMAPPERLAVMHGPTPPLVAQATPIPPGQQFDPETGTFQPEPMGGIGHRPLEGAQQAARGVQGLSDAVQMVQGVPVVLHPRQAADATSDVIEGTMQAGEAALIPAAVLNPVATGAALAGGYLAQRGADAALANADPSVRRLAGNVAGVVGGAVAGGTAARGRGVVRGMAEDARAVRGVREAEAVSRHQGFENAKPVNGGRVETAALPEGQRALLAGQPTEIVVPWAQLVPQGDPVLARVAQSRPQPVTPVPVTVTPSDVTAPASAREPWQMTPEDFIEQKKEQTGYYNLSGQQRWGIDNNGTYGPPAWIREHGALAEAAYIAGKPVPMENRPSWSITAQQVAERHDDALDDYIRRNHRAEVEEALAAGLPVPPEVLADYPDLQPPSVGEPPPVERTTAPVDVTEAGLQPRLPDDVGAVREQNIQTPEFEVPFSLLGEAAPATGVQANLLSAPAEQPWEFKPAGDEFNGFIKGQIAQGHSVPPDVYADYPGLQPDAWQVTSDEWQRIDTAGKYAAIVAALQRGQRVDVRTQMRVTPLADATQIRLSPSGKVQTMEGRGRWVTLLPGQVDALASQVGVHIPEWSDRLTHRELVEQALAAGQPVPPAVLAEYPDLTTAPNAPIVSPEAQYVSSRPPVASQESVPQSVPQGTPGRPVDPSGAGRRSRVPASAEAPPEVTRPVAVELERILAEFDMYPFERTTYTEIPDDWTFEARSALDSELGPGQRRAGNNLLRTSGHAGTPIFDLVMQEAIRQGYKGGFPRRVVMDAIRSLLDGQPAKTQAERAVLALAAKNATEQTLNLTIPREHFLTAEERAAEGLPPADVDTATEEESSFHDALDAKADAPEFAAESDDVLIQWRKELMGMDPAELSAGERAELANIQKELKARGVVSKPAPTDVAAGRRAFEARRAEATRAVDTGLVVALHKNAESLRRQASEKRSSPIGQQNVTRRRASIMDGMMRQAESLDRVAGAMDALATAHENGSIPPTLAKVKNRAQIELLLNEYRKDFPRPTLHASFVQDVIDKTKNLPNAKADRERLNQAARRARDRYITLVGQDEIGAFERLRKRAEEKGLKTHSWNLASLDDYKRVAAMGFTDGEAWTRARADMAALGTGKPTENPREVEIRKAERELIGTKIPGYFPTPKPLAERLVEEAGIEPGMTVLEPSAGKGNIADAIRAAGVDPDTMEWSNTLRKILELKGHRVIGSDFLEQRGQYDRIVMNPPFENGQDIDHVRHAYTLLKPGGRIVSIVSEGPFFRNDRKATEFRDWLDTHGGTSEKLPQGSFTGKDAERQTGTATRLVVIDRPYAQKESR